MTANDVCRTREPLEIEVGGGVILVLNQLDGLERITFSIEASLLAESIAKGDLDARMFGLEVARPLPAQAEASERSQRLIIQMVLAVEYAFVEVRGLDDPEAEDWKRTRANLTRLIRDGDPDRSVPPIVLSLVGWFNGPLVETIREGEPSAPSTTGGGGVARTSAGVVLQ